MIHLITGRPGHGKNIYALTFLEKEQFINYDKESKTFSSTIDRPLFFIAFDGINIVDSTTAKYEDLDNLPTDQDMTILLSSQTTRLLLLMRLIATHQSQPTKKALPASSHF